ncbi:uncharacterized protein BDZ99DRAFT_144488 [Mytilinidion resinicola]|uniref:Uncharacterized protein n=1 Tax=Mytilinidion resinicola TaxID=574789 RepID=A0A6A6Y8H9_9PEZI|nr:uncharacterized protein BDZ99DRAFT_144488 [Mytilinidion resinicola]KAF2804863.1 hypothetical protein BDZ99DRAFT_144488 [Mytilinidion resinicola]
MPRPHRTHQRLPPLRPETAAPMRPHSQPRRRRSESRRHAQSECRPEAASAPYPAPAPSGGKENEPLTHPHLTLPTHSTFTSHSSTLPTPRSPPLFTTKKTQPRHMSPCHGTSRHRPQLPSASHRIPPPTAVDASWQCVTAAVLAQRAVKYAVVG